MLKRILEITKGIMLRGLNRNRPKYKVVVAVFGKPISNTCYIKYLKNLFLKIEEVTGILSPALLFVRGRKNKTERRNKLSCGRSQSSILIPFVVAPRRLLKLSLISPLTIYIVYIAFQHGYCVRFITVSPVIYFYFRFFCGLPSCIHYA